MTATHATRCRECAVPLFAVEFPLGLCRRHGLEGTTLHAGLAVLRTDGAIELEPDFRRDRLNSLRDLSSILPPLPTREPSVRVVHRILTPTADDLAQIVLSMPNVDPHTRRAAERVERTFKIARESLV